MKKSLKTIIGLSTSALLLSSINLKAMAEEAESATERPTTEAVEAPTAASFQSTYISYLKAEGQLTADQLNKVPANVLEQAAAIYLERYGQEATGNATSVLEGIYGEQLKAAATEDDKEEAKPFIPPKYTEEEAAELVDRDGWVENFRKALNAFGITDEMIAKLPSDALRKAAISHLMAIPTGGDYGTAYRHFITLYPEVLVENAESLSDEEREARLKESQEKQEKIEKHLKENDLKDDQDVQKLPKDHVIKTKRGEFKIEYVFVLAPGEAGNESEDYVLGIRYDYHNTTDETVIDSATLWNDHVNLNQKVDGQRQSLEQTSYKLANEEIASLANEAVASAQHSTQTAYYKLADLEEKLYFSAIEEDKVVDYDLDLEDLLKLPMQSALFQEDTDAKIAYLFDFDTVYLIFTEADLAKDFEGKSFAKVADLADLEFSKEAQLQADKLTSTDLTVVELKEVNYEVSADGKIEVQTQDGKEILTITPAKSWTSFQDAEGNNFMPVF